MNLCRSFGPAKLARQAGLSVGDVSDILSGKRNPRVDIWLKLMRAAQDLEAQKYKTDQKNQIILEMIRDMCNQQSMRKVARDSGIDPTNLSHVLNGKRKLSRKTQVKLENILALKTIID